MRALRIIGLVISFLMIVGGVLGFVMTGKASDPATNTFACHRSNATCTTTYPILKPTIALGDITAVELATAQSGLGRGAKVETQSFVQLKTKSGDVAITPASSDHDSVAAFTKEVSAIQAFLSGTDPDLSVSSTSRDSAARSANDTSGALLSGVLGLVLFVLLLMWKPKKSASNAM
jgi:hypothetical protein